MGKDGSETEETGAGAKSEVLAGVEWLLLADGGRAEAKA